MPVTLGEMTRRNDNIELLIWLCWQRRYMLLRRNYLHWIDEVEQNEFALEKNESMLEEAHLEELVLGRRTHFVGDDI